MWMVRSDFTVADPGLNRWDMSRAAVRRVGSQLELHSRTDRNGPWGVEMWTPLQAHERMTIRVEPLDELHPEDVLGVFVFRDGACEVDIEIARWGVSDGPDVHHTGPASSSSKRLQATRLPSQHTLTVSPEALRLSSKTTGGELDSHVCPSCRPRGVEFLHVNLWRRDRTVRPSSRVRLDIEYGT